MLNGQVNIASSSDFVIAEEAVANASLYAIGSICKYNNVEVVARTDLGINNISDLEAKRLESYWDRLLNSTLVNSSN